MNRKHIVVLILGVAFLASAVLLMDHKIFNNRVKDFVGDETFKIIIQFTFISLLGGVIFLYINVVKDEETDRDARQSTERDLARELDRLYRSTKHIKRTLRSRSSKQGDLISIEEKFFTENLDKLDELQISLEQMRGIIRFYTKLFDVELQEKLFYQ